MKLSMNEICTFAKTQPSNKSFLGGESLLGANHLLHCGQKVTLGISDSDSYHIMAFCLQTSHVKDAPHEINGEILKTGKIKSMECTCKAGLSGACKHIVAALLWCNRNDLESLPDITCTDKKCIWSVPQKVTLEQYDAKPLMEHECYKGKTTGAQVIQKTIPRRCSEMESEENANSTESQKEILRKIMQKKQDSALAQHM